MPNPYPINPVLKIVVKVWMFLFTWYYKITLNISRDLKKINESYLLISNHYGRYDPFIISYVFKKRPNFVSSDAILRDKVIGRLFKGLGAMPKKKGVRDTYIIREMVKVIRAGGALALFPEGARTWNGETLFIDESIAKLIKLLKVPVITARMKGAFALDPRWSKPLRRAKVDVDYNLAISKDEINQLSEDEILSIVKDDLYQDDMAYLKEKKIRINSRKKAEYVELVLFQCTDCTEFRGFNSKGNNFKCRSCGSEIEFDEQGFFKPVSATELKFDNIKDWINWQNRNLVDYLRKQISDQNSDVLFYGNDMDIYYSRDYEAMKSIGIGRLEFFADKLRLVIDGEKKDLSWYDIQVIGPQYLERLELLCGDVAYRFVSTEEKESGIKWEIAANVIWYETGQEHKLSPYFKELVERPS